MKTCSIEGCSRGHYANGLCGAHYQRLRKGQSLTEKSKYELPYGERFAAKYDVAADGCWNWRFAKPRLHPPRANTFNYLGKVMTAYRASYLMNVGPIPDGMLVCHSCDNGMCVNPDHLWLGTHADNTNDAIRKGRANTPHGVAKPNSKLNPEKVREIRALLATGGRSQRSIAREYGINHSTLQDLVNGITWKQAV
jgi:hypothetical protein